MSALRGVFPVLHTPYQGDGSIDYQTVGAEIEWLFGHEVDGLTLALATEILRLTAQERGELLRHVVGVCAGRGPVIASVGAESTFQACEFARQAEQIGAAALMAIPPLSVVCGEDQLRQYFQAILESVSLPLVIQDASGYVGRPLSVALQAGLFEAYGPRILFKPEADPVGPLICALRSATGGEALIFEGSGGLELLENFDRGVTGTMPGSDVPWAIVRLWQALVAGETDAARAIQAPLTALVARMSGSLDAFLAIEKHLLVRQDVFGNARVRGPVGYVPDEQALTEVDALFERLQAACED